MNCIATTTIRTEPAAAPLGRFASTLHRPLATLVLVALCGCATAASDPVPEKIYDVMYTVTPDPKRATATVELRVEQTRRLLRELSMTMPKNRYSDISGDGEIEFDGQKVRWRPTHTGGVLRWTVKVPHRRYGDTFDAWLGEDWGLFRASDIMPLPGSRAVVGASSRTRLRFELPRGWSSVTQYAPRGGMYRVRSSERRFDRPGGWILLGKLGVRIENIAGIRVVVGGPTGQEVRRLDMLALLHWTMPQITKLLPDFPKRLSIVSAADAMWRGGLSGPRSLYIHAGLPLISENATSTLLHEVMHIGMGLRAVDDADWIVEGLAEFYALEILRRSRTISAERFDEALKGLIDWGNDADKLCTGASTAATTARAVGIFAALQRELGKTSMKPDALDEVVRSLVAGSGKVSLDDLRSAAKKVAGSVPRALSAANLPGCD